jgi:copper oxidase (laccase) domain-containing protein
LLEKMDRLGMEPLEAHLGPVIGPCCFEVGPDVAAHFPGFVSTTTWGTTSVDLTGFLRAEIGSLPLHTHGGCTFHDDEYWSHRRTKDPARMAAVGWIRE